MIPCSDTAGRDIKIGKKSKKSQSKYSAEEKKEGNVNSADRQMYANSRLHHTESLGNQWHLLVCFGKYSNTAAFGYIL